MFVVAAVVLARTVQDQSSLHRPRFLQVLWKQTSLVSRAGSLGLAMCPVQAEAEHQVLLLILAEGSCFCLQQALAKPKSNIKNRIDSGFDRLKTFKVLSNATYVTRLIIP